MKTAFKYTLNTLLFIIGMASFCVLMGEPTESVSLLGLVGMKALALLLLVGAFKVWTLTLKNPRS